jgi:FixJ family two-component response regulator
MYLADTSVYRSKSPPTRRSTPVVFVVDGDVSARASLESTFATEGWQPAAFACAEEFLCQNHDLGPCCLILNMALGNVDSLDLLRQMASDRGDMPIISISDQSDVLVAVRSMKAGAIEFLAKPFDDSVIVEAVRNAIGLSEKAQQKHAKMRVLRERFKSLSKREREVMSLIVKGMMNKQVGGALDISEITVKAHRGKVMQKMQAASFADLVNMAGELAMPTGRAP